MDNYNMPWIEKKENWLKKPQTKKETLPMSKAYSITEVAKLLSVSRRTIFKWLAIDEPEDAVIPPEAWFRLPSGHIRIREWVVIKLQNNEM